MNGLTLVSTVTSYSCGFGGCRAPVRPESIRCPSADTVGSSIWDARQSDDLVADGLVLSFAAASRVMVPNALA